MSSSNNNNNMNHYHNGEGQQHVGRSVAKRKFNELANAGLPAAAGGKQLQHQRAEKFSKKNRAGQQGNDAFENLHLEKLSREELIQLVRKLLLERNEAQATTEKEAEESAKQAEIVQLEQGMAELHVDLLKKMALEISTIMADLPPSAAGRHRKLPAELNCQIFYCLNLPTRRKFICGLGWDFYDMFSHRLLIKIKRVCNPHGNCWDGTNTRAVIRADGLNASNKIGYTNIMAEQPFLISGPDCRMDEFPGTILYYYEVKGRLCNFGFTDCHDFRLGGFYATPCGWHYCYHECWLGGESHDFQLPEGAIRPRMKEYGNVYGCGLVLDPEDQLWIFFTLNGKLLGRKIQITPTVDRLFPAVTMMSLVSSIEANFGDDQTKPFVYDIKNCPELGLDCI